MLHFHDMGWKCEHAEHEAENENQSILGRRDFNEVILKRHLLPKLKELNIPRTGGGGWAYPMTTRTLLIAGHGDSMLALDKASGKLIADLELKNSDGRSLGRVTGLPLTYMHKGKQFLTVALTDRRSRKSRLVALALPGQKK